MTISTKTIALLMALLASNNAISCYKIDKSSIVGGPYAIAQSKEIPFGGGNESWNLVKSQFKDGDEFYQTRTATSWDWTLVRDDCIIDRVNLAIFDIYANNGEVAKGVTNRNLKRIKVKVKGLKYEF